MEKFTIKTSLKKAIVSGANGFIGSWLVKELIANDYTVIALDLKGNNKNLPNDERISFICFDLAQAEKLNDVIKKDDYDAFYHLAWAGSAGEARSDVRLQLKNAEWAVDCLRVAKSLGCRRFICAGSIMEQETIAATYQQGKRPGSGSIYGGGKLAAHIMCMSVAAQIGIELLWPQITNAYGPGELSPRMINTAIRKCIRNEAPKFTSGTQNYDFVYIEDAARAFRMIAENGKPFHTYLIGSSKARPLKQFLLEMQAAIAPDLEFLFGDLPFTGADLPLQSFSCVKTEQDTGFRARVPFAEGTKRTMEWLKEQEEQAEDAKI